MAQTNHPLKLPSIISDNMVLQQNSNVPVWGWAMPNEKINVKASWLQKSFITQADSSGKWSVFLPTKKAGNSKHIITIETINHKITLKNILFGEVWLASGQSNMQMPLKGWPEPVDLADETIKNADIPEIRLFDVYPNTAPKPLDDCVGTWQESSPESVKGFSAVAYFFAKKLNKELNIPIGIIHSSWGGTKIQAWMNGQSLKEFQEFEQDLQGLDSMHSSFDRQIKAFEKAMSSWGKFDKYDPLLRFTSYKKMYDNVLEKWKKLSAQSGGQCCPDSSLFPKPVFPDKYPQFMVSTLYNAMIHPLKPLAIKGAIWYQGESNTIYPDQYSRLFPALINGWRDGWGQGKFPFYFVQIAPYNYLPDEEGEPRPAELRNVQLQAMLNVPNTGMVVTTDIADTTQIHSPNKKDVGERLALWALANNYIRDDVAFSGPLYKSMKVEKDKIRLFFDYAESGLVAKGGSLTHFEIAGKDGEFIKADATIVGSMVVISHNKIKNPKFVRFGWRDTAQPNLFNKAGLPASPFTTEK